MSGVNEVYQCPRDRNSTRNEDKTMFTTFSIYKMFTNFNSITIHRLVGDNDYYLN